MLNPLGERGKENSKIDAKDSLILTLYVPSKQPVKCKAAGYRIPEGKYTCKVFGTIIFSNIFLHLENSIGILLERLE